MVSYSITTPVKAVYVAYWNGYDAGKNPSGIQGVRFCAPLPSNAGGGNGGGNGGGGNANSTVAVDDAYTTKVNKPVTINPLNGDSDPEGDTFSIKSINGTALTDNAQTITVPHGTVEIDASGNIKFVPDTDYVGNSTFLYEIEDAKGATATANETITIENTPPVAVDDNYTTPLDTPVVINPLNADSDSDINDTISIKSINGHNFVNNGTIPVNHGSLEITNGVIKFVPDNGYTGNVNFNYTIKDRYGKTAQATDRITILPKVSTPKISLIESVDNVTDTTGDGNIGVGDTVRFKYLVKNVGNTVLYNLDLNDSKVGAVNCPSNTIALNGSIVCYKNYTITAADVANGAIEASSTATAKDLYGLKTSDISDTGTTPNGTNIPNPESVETPNPLKEYNNNPNDPTEDPTTVYIKSMPKVSLVESVDDVIDVDGDNVIAAGDEVKFKYVVTNVGTTDITELLSLNDAKVGSINCSINSALSRGDSVTCYKEYTITQADVNAGIIVATSTVRAKDENDKEVTDVSDAGTDPNGIIVDSPNTKETYTPNGNPTDDPTALLLTKNPQVRLIESVDSVADTTNDSNINVGDTVTFKYEIKNIGNVPLTDVYLNDKTVGDVTCAKTTLAIHETMICYKDYTIKQEDVDNGTIEASSVVTAKDPDNKAVSDTSDAGTKPNGDTIPNPEATETPNPLHKYPNNRFDPTEDPTSYTLDYNPKITLVKSVKRTIDVDGDNNIWKGDKVEFEYVVTNSGNVNLTNVAITDDENPLVPGSLSCPKTELAVGESMTCSAMHIINDTDISKKSVVGKATVGAKDPKGNDVTADSDAGTDLKKNPVNDPKRDSTDPIAGTYASANNSRVSNPTSLVLINANDDKPHTVTDYQDITIDVAANDEFVGPVRVEILEPPRYGSARVVYDNNGNPKIIYKADPDANNVNDSFKYRISDNYGNSDVATANFELKCSSTQRSDSGDALSLFGIMAMFISLFILVNRKERRRA